MKLVQILGGTRAGQLLRTLLLISFFDIYLNFFNFNFIWVIIDLLCDYTFIDTYMKIQWVLGSPKFYLSLPKVLCLDTTLILKRLALLILTRFQNIRNV